MRESEGVALQSSADELVASSHNDSAKNDEIALSQERESCLAVGPGVSECFALPVLLSIDLFAKFVRMF